MAHMRPKINWLIYACFLSVTAGVMVAFGIETGQGTLVQILKGHQDELTNLAFSPDSKLIATSSSDNSIRIWDINLGKEKQIIRVDKPVYFLAFSPNGADLAGASETDVSIWDISTGKKKLTRKSFGEIFAQSPDGQVFAGRKPDSSLFLEEAKTGRVLKSFASHPDEVRFGIFLRIGKLLATSCRDGLVRVWNTDTGKLYQTIPSPGATYQIAASSDGTRLVQSHWERSVVVWDIDNKKQVFTRTFDMRVYGVAFSPDGKHVAAGSEGELLLLDSDTGKILKTCQDRPTGIIGGVVYSPDGKLLATTNLDNSVRLWDMTKLFPLQSGTKKSAK